MPFGRQRKRNPLEEKQAQLQAEQSTRLLEAVHQQRMAHADEYAKAYVENELAKVKTGEVIPTVQGFKSKEEINQAKNKSSRPRIAGVFDTLSKVAGHVQVPNFGASMAQSSSAGSLLAPPRCKFCGHGSSLHKDGICHPQNGEAHHCGKVE